MTSTAALLYNQTSFLWRIPNFAEVCKSEERLREQQFQFEMHVGVIPKAAPLEWKCWLEATEMNEASYNQVDTVGVFLHLSKVPPPPPLRNCLAKVRFQFANHETGCYYLDGTCTTSMAQFVEDPDSGHGIPNSLPRVFQNPPFLTKDGVLEIQVTVAVYLPEAQNVRLAVLEAQFEEYFAGQLRYTLDSLGKNDPLDTKIVSKDGIQFPVSHVILAARSPVFREMFQSNMSEQQKGVVEVKDIDSKPLAVLLHFIQTWELAKNWKNEDVLEGLVYGAHKYMVKDLVKFLDAVLGALGTNQTCAKLMGLAKTFGLKNAEEELFNYFKKNMARNMDEVLKFAEETTKAAGLMRTSAGSVGGGEETDDESQPKKRKA